MPNDIIEIILETICNSGKSINQIAKESGVSRNTISAWLHQKSMPTVFNAQMVLNSIGYTLILTAKEKR
jgi:transcriptional regulator with XRE-family HTH domain